MSAVAITEHTEITLFFSLSLPSGQVVDSNFGARAATFIYADGSLLPGFERQLLGLKAGDKKQCTVPAEDAFGSHKPENLQVLPRSRFDPTIALEKGLVVSFAEPSGGELPGVVSALDDQQITVDFNHPLAGQAIVFAIEIVAVKPVLSH